MRGHRNQTRSPGAAAPRSFLRDNGLTLALLAVFAASVVGHAWMGWLSDAHDRALHHQAALSLGAYLAGGQFLSTLFENWESEFLQMWAYVMLTAYLFQRGSPESKAVGDPHAKTGG